MVWGKIVIGVKVVIVVKVLCGVVVRVLVGVWGKVVIGVKVVIRVEFGVQLWLWFREGFRI